MVRAFLFVLLLLVPAQALALEYQRNSCVELQPDPRYAETMEFARAGERVAMVVGNSKYEQTGALPNAANDATAIAERLQKLGFRVTLVLDSRDTTLMRCVDGIRDALTFATLSVFYYAGHGTQVDDENFAIAVDADFSISNPTGFTPISAVVRAFAETDGAALIFLDSCRSNAFKGASRPGLAVADVRSLEMPPPIATAAGGDEQPRGLFIAYATSPNQTASDGSGSHSPFTQAILETLGTPGHTLARSFSEVTRLVGEATEYTQVPWSRSSLDEEVYLNGRVTESDAASISLQRSRAALELLYQGRSNAALVEALSGIPRSARVPIDPSFQPALSAARTAMLSRVYTIAADKAPEGYAISPDRSRVITLDRLTGRSVYRLWDKEGALVRLLADLPFEVAWGQPRQLMGFSENNGIAYAQTGPTEVTLWDAASGQTKITLAQALERDWVRGIEVNHDGSKLLTQSRESFAIWETADGTQVASADYYSLRDRFPPHESILFSEYPSASSVLAYFIEGDRIAFAADFASTDPSLLLATISPDFKQVISASWTSKESMRGSQMWGAPIDRSGNRAAVWLYGLDDEVLFKLLDLKTGETVWSHRGNGQYADIWLGFDTNEFVVTRPTDGATEYYSKLDGKFLRTVSRADLPVSALYGAWGYPSTDYIDGVKDRFNPEFSDEEVLATALNRLNTEELAVLETQQLRLMIVE